MKVCENCKKVYQDDMNYCPYCGTKYHDYKEDLKQAMDDLFDENKVEKKPVFSRVKKQEMLREEKTNKYLNIALTALIVMIIGTVLVGAVMIGEKFLPTQPGVIENTNPTTDEPSVDESETVDEIIDDKDDEIVDDNIQEDEIVNEEDQTIDIIDVTNNEDGDFTIDKIKVKKENDQVKIEIKCNALMAGNIFLKDSGSLNIGPINIKEGKNEFYFTVSGNTDYKLFFDASNGRDYEYLINKELLDKAIKRH